MISKLFNFFYVSIISIFRKKSIDYNTWIFSSSFNTKFNYNSKYLFEYVLHNEPTIKPIYVINDEKLRLYLQNKYGEDHFIETKSKSGIKKVLNSGVWFTSAGLPIYGLNINKKRLIVNLWHGVPLKKIALMENKINLLRKMYFRFIFSKNYSFIFTTSKKLVSIMSKSFGVCEDKIQVLGQPRNDLIFRTNNRVDILNSMFSEMPDYDKIILYAPTFRDKNETKFFPFDDYIMNELNHFLEENKLIIFIRCHQSETHHINIINCPRVKIINEDKIEDIMEIINIFDLLITDYSSIYIDYLLTEKPILFLPYDINEYIKNRGLNFDYDSVTPGPKPSTFTDFKIEIIKLLNEKNYYFEKRKNLNDFFNEIKNQCSKDICKYIMSYISKSKKEI